MKIRKICYIIFTVLMFAQIFCGCGGYTNTKPMRIHVRADSDSTAAQTVKREVAAVIESYLYGELCGVKDYDGMIAAVSARTETVRMIADSVLARRGCGYSASVELTCGYFAERELNGDIVPAGNYDALIVRLGSGGGDNWWSVVYPSAGHFAGGGDSQYKSLIAEILGK